MSHTCRPCRHLQPRRPRRPRRPWQSPTVTRRPPIVPGVQVIRAHSLFSYYYLYFFFLRISIVPATVFLVFFFVAFCPLL